MSKRKFENAKDDEKGLPDSAATVMPANESEMHAVITGQPMAQTCAKVRKRGRKNAKICFEFMHTGKCKYGEKCRYDHVHQNKERLDLANREKIMNRNPKNSSYVERTFWQLYCPDNLNSNDRYVFLHPNDIAIVGLAETHPIFESDQVEVKFFNHALQNKEISNVDTSGKSKKGGIKCSVGDLVCIVTDLRAPSKEYKILTPIAGLLIEINERLIKQPELLLSHPHTLGYLGIFQAAKRMKMNVSDCWEKASFARLRNLELPGSEGGNLADISTHGKSFRGFFKQKNFHAKSDQNGTFLTPADV